MNKAAKFFALIGMAATIAGCADDNLRKTPTPTGDQYVRAALNLNVAEDDRVTTRAEVDDASYDKSNVWVLMFGNDNKLIQRPVKATQEVTPEGTKLFAMLRSTPNPLTLYVVAGLSSELNSKLTTSTDFNENSTYTDVNNALQTAEVTSAGIAVGDGSYLPMSSEARYFYAGTVGLHSIDGIELIRRVARIDIDASALTEEFKLEGAAMALVAKKGHVLHQSHVPTDLGGGTVNYDLKTGVVDNKLEAQIYINENTVMGTSRKPTMIIVKGSWRGGESGYYRMDIVNTNFDKIDIKRNTRYTLKITRITNSGYHQEDVNEAINEAINGVPSNSTYNAVTVSDTDSNDIVTNGAYYLGVSNSDFVVYCDDSQVTDMLVTTVNTNAPRYTTVGLSTSDPDILLNPTNLFPATGGTIKTEIYAKVKTSSLTDRYIIVRVGNLTRKVTIRREPAVELSETNGRKSDFTDPSYVYGKVDKGGEWARLSVSNDVSFDSSSLLLYNTAGGMCINYDPSKKTTDNMSVAAELYGYKSAGQGRSKVMIYVKP
jgi:hypothetical protein